MAARDPVQQEGVKLPLVYIVEDPLGHGWAEVVEESRVLGEQPRVQDPALLTSPPTGGTTRALAHT